MNTKILIIDDSVESRRLLATLLKKKTDFLVSTAKSGTDIKNMMNVIIENPPDLILLDLMMPGMDGFEVTKLFKKTPRTKDIPIIFITGIEDKREKLKALQLGGVDYIYKPFDDTELLTRIKNQVHIKKLHDELKMKNELLKNREKHLMHLVSAQTEKIENITVAMVTILENVNSYNDTDTGEHIKRVSLYSAFLAEKLGSPPEFVRRIKIFSSLHDVGKVGIPDRILKKPGKYTDEEFEEMKQHVAIGGSMLADKSIDEMATNIATYHHEKWDGSGYLKGLKGAEIPLEARIVALADVYDALTTKRVYKEPIPSEEVDKIITSNSGTHFDPELVNLYLEHREEFKKLHTEKT